MAAVASLPHSAHFLGPNTYPAFHHAHHQHQRAGHQQQGSFGAFAHYHHASPHSPASSSSSWREHAPVPVPGPKRTTAFTPRRRSASPPWHRAAVNTPAPSAHTTSSSSTAVARSSSRIYSVEELLRLASSPLVGVSHEKQAVLTDITEHWVWRRGAHPEPKRTRRSRSPRSSSPSTRSASEESS
ncbi:hypothetical protein PENSPDRAFT_98541 [Peniophora sp. CONT]|nr:hypothetical protein PENSPDRAFT_98541 [Peniophora sp. CONT]